MVSPGRTHGPGRAFGGLKVCCGSDCIFVNRTWFGAHDFSSTLAWTENCQNEGVGGPSCRAWVLPMGMYFGRVLRNMLCSCIAESYQGIIILWYHITKSHAGIILRNHNVESYYGAVLWQIYYGRRITAGTLWQVCYGRYIMADVLRHKYYGRNITAAMYYSIINIYIYIYIYILR